MIKTTGTVSAILIASATVVFAQGSGTQSTPQGVQPPQMLGQTGTMHDGNNARLQLPPEPNSYWANLWAASVPAENTSPAAATAASPAGERSHAGGQ